MKPDLIKPSKPEINRRSRLFEYLLLVLVVAFAILAFAAKTNPYFPFDLFITRSIQLIHNVWFANVMLLMTEIGYPLQGTLLAILTPLVLLALKRKQDALILFVSTAGAGLLSVILKAIVARPRPDPMLIEQLTSYKVNDSFPSGHVLFFMGFMGYLLYFCYLYFPKGWSRNIAMSICLVLIVLMGMSRIYFGAHWFSDTLGAYLIGTIWLYGVIYFRHRFVDFPTKKSS